MPSQFDLAKSIVGRRTKSAHEPKTQVGKLVAAVLRSHAQAGGSFVEPAMAASFISMESFDSRQAQDLQDTLGNLDQVLQQAISTEGLTAAFTNSDKELAYVGANQMAAGVLAGLMTGNIGSTLQSPVIRKPAIESNETWIDMSGQGDMMSSRLKEAVESYDEKDNRHATAYSVAYNMLTARQDEFGEAFFPTVIVSPDQVGYVVTIRLINVMKDIRRQISGDIDQFNKTNIIHGVIDATLLDNPQTNIVPVVRDESEKNFVDTTKLPPKDVILAGETISTSALAFNRKFSLLGISQPDSLLATGQLDVTDSIDTAITLRTVYLSVGAGAGAEIIKIQTSQIPYSNFNYAVQGHYRLMQLNFNTTALGLKGVVQKADGTGASAVLAPINANNVSVQLALSVNGSVNLETADTSLSATNVEVHAVFDENNQPLPLTSGLGQTIANLFTTATAIGYDLDARRTNVNRRQRGLLLTSDFYSQLYPVPLHAPITTLRPVTISDQTDASDLAALITATHIRTSNSAVTRLLEASQTLAAYVTGAQTQVVQAAPEILGAASWLVEAFYEAGEIDLPAQIDSLKSFERMADVQSLLVNVVRDFAYRAYRNSGYKAAADALAGGIAPKPTVIIGTDPVIANYMMVTGEFRTLGNDFNVKVVSTLDSRVRDKIYVSFGQFGEGKEGQPNPMHFGNMGWKPEVTLVLPMTRNGQISKELTVQPSYVHVVNLPILGEFTVVGLSEVVDQKVTLNMHEVAP